MPVIVTPTDVTNVATEFATEDPARIELFIDIARQYVCETAWGDKAKTAIILYTAHLLTLAKYAANGAAGPITSEKVGELSRNYGSSADSEAGELAQTPWGKIILSLRKTIIITPMVV